MKTEHKSFSQKILSRETKLVLRLTEIMFTYKKIYLIVQLILSIEC